MATSILSRPSIQRRVNLAAGFLDALYLDDDNLPAGQDQRLLVAAAAVEAFNATLRSGVAVHADVLARLLDGVVHELRESARHVGNAVIELGELQMSLDE
jgi:hypothetical protein